MLLFVAYNADTGVLEMTDNDIVKVLDYNNMS